MQAVQFKIDAEQEEVVRETLRSILGSPHFAKSKRYPAFLEHVVIGTVEGNDGALKERVLAMEVFSRDSDYDATADSVVRVVAGEVRKRLAQYFNEHPDAPVQISLPIGSYTAEFRFPQREHHDVLEELAKATGEPFSAIALHSGPDPAAPLPSSHKTPFLGFGLLAGALLALTGVAAAVLHKPDPARDFWKSFLQSGQTPFVLPGKIANYNPGFGSLQQLGSESSFYTGSAQPLENVIVVAHVCGLFYEYHHECNISEASSETLEHVAGKPLVLVGGFNNLWTMRLQDALPYRLQYAGGTGTARSRAIVEHKQDGDAPLWIAHENESRSQEVTDYAILARFHSDVTDSTVVVIAGLDRTATVSGGDFVLSSEDIGRLFSQAPKGWKGTNFEAVLQTDVMAGSHGHSKVIATKFW